MDVVIDLTEVRCPNCSTLIDKEEDRLPGHDRYQCGNQLCGYRFYLDPKGNGRRHKQINTHCVWYMSGSTCGIPLTNGDVAFCPKHRRVVTENYRVTDGYQEYRRHR